MEKEKRIEIIASFVDNGARIADIGSDHCAVPILLMRQKKITFAQAVENKKGPYQRMRQEILKSGFQANIHPNLSDGIESLDPTVDTLIIAGMGGRLILSILERHPEKLENIKTIIVDAHNDRPMVISKLSEKGFVLDNNEFFYESGIAYDVMKWTRSAKKASYSEIEVEFGPFNVLRKNEAWRAYWQSEKQRMIGILSQKGLPEKKKIECEQKIALIEAAFAYRKLSIND